MMSEQDVSVADEQTGGNQVDVVPEVRTRRLVVVNEAGMEQAVLQVHHGMMEVCVGGGQSGVPCQVVIFAGEDEPGTFSAGVELWAKDESVSGSTVSVTGGVVEVHCFGEGEAGQECERA